MDEQQFKTLEILDEISNNDKVTQREISRKVGIALGLANFYVKRLVQKGYVEVTYLERNRLGYLITPKGIAEKSRLTYSYIQRSYQYVRKVRVRMRDHLIVLAREGVGMVVIYGAGDMAEVAYLALQEAGMKLTAVVDPHRDGRPFLGYTVMPVAAIPRLAFDRILVTEPITLEDVGNLFQEYGIGEERLIHLE
jgi:predicted transcriptional regulator